MDAEKQEQREGHDDDESKGQNGTSPTRSEAGESLSEETLQQQDNEVTIDGEKDGDLKRTQSIAETMSLPHEIAFVATICMAQFLTQVGLNGCLAIIHIIGDSFGLTNPGELSWLIAGYSLTVGTFIMISGRFGDVFGYKRMLLIGFAWFSLWSMILGFSVYSNHVLFTFARVFQGIGPAIALPNALAILGATYADGPRKNMVFAIFGATAPGGAIVGGAFAGVFALAWWPWAFFSLSIAIAITAIMGSFVIPDPPKKQPQHHHTSLRQKFIDLDLLGAAVGIAALVLFNFAWNQAPIVGWQKAYVYVLMILGILLVPVFFYIELRVSPSPLIAFDALSPDVGFVLACIACGWSCFGIYVFYIWQFFVEIRGASPLLGAAWLSPVAVSGAVAAVCTGFLLGRLRPAWVMTIALTMFTVGTILIATAPVRQTYWAQAFACAVVIPWGMITLNSLFTSC
jgi:MFS family permease